MELPIERWAEIKKMCEKFNVEFLATPFSNTAVDLLQELNVDRYKVGSGDIHNLLMLEKIAKTGKEIILSTGLANDDELEETVNFLSEFDSQLSILQCTTKYPTEAKDVRFDRMLDFSKKFDFPIGLSDHSGEIFPGIAAVSMGASIVEAHITFDKRMFGPDSVASLSIDNFQEMVRGIRFIEEARGLQQNIKSNANNKDLKRIFGRSITVNKNLDKGSKITFEDLEGAKPSGMGIDVNEFRNILGKSLSKSKLKGNFLNKTDFL